MDEYRESTLQMSCPALSKKTMQFHKSGVMALTNPPITQLIQLLIYHTNIKYQKPPES